MGFFEIPIVGDIIRRGLDLIPDLNARAAAKEAFATADLDAATATQAAQLQIALAEANSPSRWASGARPAVMWVCAVFFLWLVIHEIWSNLLVATGHPPLPPSSRAVIDMFLYLFGVLAAVRGAEKFGGVASGQSAESRAVAVTTRLRSSVPIVVARTGGVP